jgi:ribosomal 30S subunit maturation factor RimM
VSVAGCETVEAASLLVGRLFALPEDEALPLPPGQFYPWQLEGCRVLTDDGREVGRVTRIEQSASQICGCRATARARFPDPGGGRDRARGRRGRRVAS